MLSIDESLIWYSKEVKRNSLVFYIDKIKCNDFFTFPKILHGFWEKLADVDIDTIPAKRLEYHQRSLIYNTDHRARSLTYDMLEDTYYGELFPLIRGEQPPGNFFLGVSHIGYPGDDALIHPEHKLIKVMKILLTGNDRLHCGLVWKNSCYTGEIIDFIKVIRSKKVVAVGMPHLRELGDAWNLPNFYHYLVNPPIANQIDSTIKGLMRFGYNHRNTPTIYLFQLGGSATALILYKLHNQMKNCFMIDMGRSLDAWFAEGENQSWVKEMSLENRRLLNLPI